MPTWLIAVLPTAIKLAIEFLRYALGRLKERRRFNRALQLSEAFVFELEKSPIEKMEKAIVAREGVRKQLDTEELGLATSLIDLAVSFAVNKLRHEQGNRGER